MFGPPHRKSPPGTSPRVTRQAAQKQLSLDSFRKLAAKSKSDSGPTEIRGQGVALGSPGPSQNKSQTERVTEGVARGNPKKLQKTNTTEEKRVDPEESPTSSPSATPTPSLSPPGTARSGGSPADTATGSEDAEDANASTGGAGDTTRRATRIRTAEEGRKYLVEAHLVEPEDELDGEVLAGTLVQVSLFPGMSQAARDAVRSVALLLVRSGPSEAAAPALNGCMEHMVSEFTAAIKSVTQMAIAEVKTASSTLTETSTRFTATATSYRDALASKGPSPNPVATAATMDMRARAREGIKLRQILIDARDHGEGILRGVSDAGIVESANAAIRRMEDPPDHRFVSARRLGNGGVLLEMDSESAAGWLNVPVTRASFLNQFAPNASFKERAFPIVVQFVPLHFKPDKAPEIRQVEKDNGLPDGSLLRARWIKPAHRRARDQTCGHIILVASTADMANKMLTNGLVVCQKRVYAEKCKKEPTRCLKCQGWGHLSYDCKLTQDTCGTCAGRHRTATCAPGSRPRCVSCGIEGHASWSRLCPVFVQKCEEMNGRLTENNMPYFPTDEPWTHVLHPPKSTYRPPPPTAHNRDYPSGTARGSYRQSTLQFPQVRRRPYDDTQPTNAPANTQGHGGAAPPAGDGRGGPEQSRAWGDSDPLDGYEGLPTTQFI